MYWARVLVWPGVFLALVAVVLIRGGMGYAVQWPPDSSVRNALWHGSPYWGPVLTTLWFGMRGSRVSSPVRRCICCLAVATFLAGLGAAADRNLPRSIWFGLYGAVLLVWTTSLTGFVLWMHRQIVPWRVWLTSCCVVLLVSQVALPAVHAIEASLGLHYVTLSVGWCLLASPQLRYLLDREQQSPST